MCGINGIFAYGANAPPPREEECLAVRDAMRRRGPDGEGLYRDPSGRLLVGHRRLAIIDLSEAGHQPMVAPEGDLVVSFNGEIYNYREIQEDLSSRGVTLRTQSDTEVLLHLYRREGEAMVHRLRGMFAFAIWDARDRTLLLARDPYGIKPLYYADDGGTFRFASSVRALLMGSGVGRAPDPAGIVGYLTWGSVPEPWTVFQSIRVLPAGSTLRVGSGGVGTPKAYWSLPGVYARRDGSVPPPERTERVRAALRESVARHLVADVPVGIFLSSGVDSGALLGIASEISSTPIEAVTLAFEEFRGTFEDEAPLASAVAARYGARHRTVTISRDEIRRGLDEFIDAMDQPTVDGLNSYWVSQAVRRAGLKAALSGLGGDELFGGYPSFALFPQLRRLAWIERIPGPARVWEMVAGYVGYPARRTKLRRLVTALRRPAATYQLIRGLFTPVEVAAIVDPGVLADAGGEERLLEPAEILSDGVHLAGRAAVAAVEQCVYMRNQLLRDSDWASMTHGLELRLPLVDRTLVETIGPLLTRWSRSVPKLPLARAPHPPLPARVWRRRKSGFGFPMQHWIGYLADGRAPRWPRGMVGAAGEAYLGDLLRQVLAGRAHWSRYWAPFVLARYLEATGCSG